jgi:hypothetical protein
MYEVAVQYIKCYIRPCMPQVAFAAYSGPAHIHTHIRRVDGGKHLFLAAEGIVYFQ